jgi:hypothetical protein
MWVCNHSACKGDNLSSESKTSHYNYLDYSYMFIRIVDIKIIDKATQWHCQQILALPQTWNLQQKNIIKWTKLVFLFDYKLWVKRSFPATREEYNCRQLKCDT